MLGAAVLFSRCGVLVGPLRTMVDPDRLEAAYKTARADLLAECDSSGHWVGRLASSPLSTATAISALVVAEQHKGNANREYRPEEVYQGDLSELIVGSLHWLAGQQNDDGGWGDTDRSLSNIATTMLVTAAFRLTGVPVKYSGMMERAEACINTQGGVAGLRRRFGRDKTFAVPILTNCALAGLVPWRQVSPLPFELACFPQSMYRLLRLPVVSYAIPALVAIGQARFHHAKPLNPITRMIRSAAVEPSLKVLEAMQPESGGFLEATPLTSFVVMSLASIGRAEHPVTRRGVEFLLASVRHDGSWPIDSNLATWNTTLSINALAAGGEDISSLECLDWLLSCQHTEEHPMSGATPGGWAWTDLAGGVPDVDDTAGALLALAAWRSELVRDGKTSDDRTQRIERAARDGVEWLLGVQNNDGGWPTFCRGWGKLPFDRSAPDLTAHAMRAFCAWRNELSEPEDDLRASDTERSPNHSTRQSPKQKLSVRIAQAMEAGQRHLANKQRDDGSWVPLWFGNQYHKDEENPIYGTARVLPVFRDLAQLDSDPARRAIEWLIQSQDVSGGWSGDGASEKQRIGEHCTVEETALAVDALLAVRGGEPLELGEPSSLQVAIDQGLAWLAEAIESGRHQQSAPIGFYFAKLWYYERLYPMIFAVSALGQAAGRLHEAPTPTPAPTTTLHRSGNPQSSQP